MAKKRSPTRIYLSVEREGKLVTASYTVVRGVVTVRYRGRSLAMPAGNSPVDRIAHLLLVELLAKRKKTRLKR
jgi:hypothetical protein